MYIYIYIYAHIPLQSNHRQTSGNFSSTYIHAYIHTYTMCAVPPIEELQALLISDGPTTPMLADTATTPGNTATDNSETLKRPTVPQIKTMGGGLYTNRGGTLYASTATSGGGVATEADATATVTSATATDESATLFRKYSKQKKAVVETVLTSGNTCVCVCVCMYIYI